MEVHRSAADITVLAPAKLNLFFEVLAKRLDGFHEVETLMVPIDLFDVLRFRPNESGELRLDCRWDAAAVRAQRASADEESNRSVALDAADAAGSASSGALPAERDNLAWRALHLLRERAGIRAGASVELVKRIPAAAGLGGGSSDAAAALVAGNIGWDLNWPIERLASLAAELGSDVPFFLISGAAVCRGRGEKTEPVGQLAPLCCVVIRPPEGHSTAQVYARCRPGVSSGVGPLVAALRRGDLRTATRHLGNRLELAAEQLSAWPGRLRVEFSRLDCAASQMSGSGSSYFGICRHARHARRMARRLDARRLGRVFAVRS